MKKRKIKKGKVALAVSIFLIVIAAILLGILYLINASEKNSKVEKEPVKEEIQEEVKVEEPKEKRLSIVSVGDALIHTGVYLDASLGNGNYDFSSMFTDLTPIIQNYDLRYYNQETIIGGKDLGVQTYPRFNSPDEIGLDLVNAGFNMVSLANNHTLDMGEQGILNSVNFWRNTGIIFDGQSDSFEDRNNIPIYEQNGIKYAFLAYTDTTNGLSVPYGKEYLVNVYSDEQARIDIESVQDKVDVIIVSMHWGEEYTHTPTYRQKQEAQYLSSLGVDLIIGSHPHVIMPIDYVGDTLVIYSLGNLISSQSPLGLAKIIGLLVGVEIVVNEDKVTFENLNYQLLYTYCTPNYKDYKVIPFDNLTDDILYNHESIEQEYLNIVTSEVTYD